MRKTKLNIKAKLSKGDKTQITKGEEIRSVFAILSIFRIIFLTDDISLADSFLEWSMQQQTDLIFFLWTVVMSGLKLEMGEYLVCMVKKNKYPTKTACNSLLS